MGVVETAIIYAILGVVTAAALFLQERKTSALSLAGALVFWPLFAPFVLSAHRTTREPPANALDRRIDAAEQQLVAALSRLKGFAEDLLAPEIARVHRLALSLRGMSKRVTEMDALLATPEFALDRARLALAELQQKDDPRRRSLESRFKNIERLQAMRARTGESLERALLEMEEMSSHIVVLALAGAETEVVHQIREIAAGIEGVAEGLFDAA